MSVIPRRCDALEIFQKPHQIIRPESISFMRHMQELFERGGLELLAAFVAVADSGSFTEAAKKLGRDASIVSRRISQLENELGVSLFSRTTRRVALTEIGARYHHRVQALLEELSMASREASDIAAAPRGLLRVSVPVTFGRQWIGPLLPRFLASHPDIRLDVRFSDRVVDVVAEGFDVAIRVGRLRDSTLKAHKIASYRNLLVAAPAYLDNRGRPRIPEDLRKHDCISFTGLVGWPDWSLSKAGKSKTIRAQGPLIADNSEIVLAAAIAGAGITYTADWLAGPALKTGKLVEVLSGWGGKGEGGVYAVLPPGRLVPAKTRLFVDEIARSIRAGWGKSY